MRESANHGPRPPRAEKVRPVHRWTGLEAPHALSSVKERGGLCITISSLRPRTARREAQQYSKSVVELGLCIGGVDPISVPRLGECTDGS